MKKLIISAIFILTTLIFIIFGWPENKSITIDSNVKAAINSVEPMPRSMQMNVNNYYPKITLGEWSGLNIQCAFPKRNDNHISRNNLKRKELVLYKKKAYTLIR